MKLASILFFSTLTIVSALPQGWNADQQRAIGWIKGID
jgi:hypothetical protein